MKRLIKTLTLSLLLICKPVFAYDAVFVFSPHQSPDTSKVQVQAALKYLVNEQPGYKALLIDGYNLKTLGEYHNPDSALYKSPKARLKKNAATIKALMEFAKSSKVPSADNSPKIVGALRIPQALRFVAENHTRNKNAEIILLGSSLYDDPRDAAFTMAGGLIPSDGHLNVSRSISPYGAIDQPELSKSLRVHFLLPGNQFASDQHLYFIKRFWTLYVQQQGGSLVSFSGDAHSVFSNIRNKPDIPPHDFKLDPTTKLEMIRLLKIEGPEKTIYERSLSTAPLPESEITFAENIMLGLSWDCDCDLDIYALPFEGAKILFFANKTTAQGRHWKDYVRSPRKSRAYETIEFKVPLDLNRLQIAVNFYSGHAPNGASGELRLAIGSKVYATNFTIPAGRGKSLSGVKESLRSGSPEDANILIFNAAEIVRHAKPSP